MQTKAIVAAATAVMLTGCVPPAPLDPSQLVLLTPEQAGAVQAGIRGQLKDPTSPLFGTMVAGPGPDGNLNVCGIVNAKNSFGGYVGDQPYMGILMTTNGQSVFVPTVVASAAPGDSGYVSQQCQRAGLFLAL